MFLDGGRDEHHMIVYHALGSTLCMFVPVIRDLTVEFYRQLVSTPSLFYKGQAIRDNIKILGNLVCLFVCMSVCVYKWVDIKNSTVSQLSQTACSLI